MWKKPNLKELEDTHPKPKTASFSAFLMLSVAIVAALFPSAISVGTLILTVIAGIFFRSYLEPLNTLWHRFGLLLGHFISPLILAAFYFLLLTPFAIVTRPFRRPLRSKSWVEKKRQTDFSKSF